MTGTDPLRYLERRPRWQSMRREEHTFVFVGGLHRSGTTLLARWLAQHPAISGFERTGVPRDEGQHLQSVYPPALRHGGPGRFAFSGDARLTEASPLASEWNRGRLLTDWGRYWDLTCPVLLEKSPPNLIRSRFLQALFPGAHFFMVIRNPAAVALATKEWSAGSTLGSLLRHWLIAHRCFLEDAAHLENVALVPYEGLVADPAGVVGRVLARLGLARIDAHWDAKRGLSHAYGPLWSRHWWNVPRRAYVELLMLRYERTMRKFGYTLRDPSRRVPPSREVSALLLA